MEIGRELPADSDLTDETPSDNRDTHTDSTCTKLSEDEIRELYKQLDDKVTTHTNTVLQRNTHTQKLV